ncbi:MAG: OmpA family protein [Micropepsaceae bacterium]
MLKNLLLASAMALSVYTLSTTAEAGRRPQGWYIGIEAGATWMDTANLDMSPVSKLKDAELKFDDGLAVLGEVGYRWENNWRIELEFGSRHNDAKCSPALSPACVAGGFTDVSQFSQMLNVIHDIDLNEKTALSVGIGLGGDFVDADGTGFLNDDDYVFAAQAIFQLSHELTEGIDLVLSYRFMTSDDAEFRKIGIAGGFDMDNESHTVTVGLRFDLEPDAVAMEPTPVVQSAPPPVAPPAPRQFIVFFGFNKSSLSREAMEVVKEAASVAMHEGFVTILVTGHTDTVGSSKYNQALSIRRASSVKKALVSKGIPASGITPSGRGETTLLVQTGDHEMEPKNRRAEINLN